MLLVLLYMSKKILTISEARKHLFEIAEEVQKPGNFCTLTIEGEPKVIMLAKKEFDALMETVELLSNPAVLQQIKKVEEEYAQGEYYTWNQLKERVGIKSPDVEPLVVRSPRAEYRVQKKT